MTTSDRTGINKTLKEEDERLQERQAQLDATVPERLSVDNKGSVTFDSTGPDHHSGSVAGNQRHQPVGDKAHFSEKIYMFPDSFNALREELQHNWPSFFWLPNPEHGGASAGWAMVFDAPLFVAMCNAATDSSVQFDSFAVDKICSTFLNKFRAMRGVGAIQ